MKFLTTFVLLGLPGVAFTSRLDPRQGAPSGNSSIILPPQSPSSHKEPAAPSLVATSSPVTNPSSIPKQERGPQGGDSVGPPDTPPEPPLGIVTPVELPPEETRAIPAATPTPTPTDADTNIDTPSTLAFPSLSTTGASTDTSLAGLTTIITTNSLLVGGSPPTTLFTSKITPGAVTSTQRVESGTTTATVSSDISSPTQTATMSNPTTTPSSVSSSDSNGNSTLTIALSTVLSVVGVVLIATAAYLCTGGRRKRIPGFNRGITPIGDDEIATWKSNRSAEKVADRYTSRPSHSQNASTSTRRAPSVIQYQHGGRPSLDVVSSPRSFIDGKYSFDLPQAPGAVLARAPNARSGLTDDMVPGDDPFLPSPKRHPSRLHKLPPGSPSMHGRTKGSRSSSLRSFAEAAWRQGEGAETTSSPRGSSDAHSRNNHYRIYSNSTIPPPPRLSFGDNEQLTGLSPPPSRRQDSSIGLAVG
ncbi:hypothetical protein Hte_004447 [Hypoxylon texense]